MTAEAESKAHLQRSGLPRFKKPVVLHQRIADTRRNWNFKLAPHLCDGAGTICVEDLDFRTMAKGMLGKHTLDAGLGQFTNQILP